MQCITPTTITRNYRKMGERWQNAAVSVPCGKCPICLKKRAADWCFRLEKENQISSTSCFITLTYESPPLSPNGLMTLNRSHLTKFLKRLRKTTHEKLKYYAIGEYGTQFKRPHYHLILFNYPIRKLLRFEPVLNTWHGGRWEGGARPGFIQIDACNPASIGYVANYCQVGSWTPDHCRISGLMDDRQPHFSVMSKKLGLNYLTPQVYNYHVKQLANFVTRPGGAIQRLPKYFRDKIFTHAEKKEIQNQYQELEAYDWEKLFNNAHHHVDYIENTIHNHYKRLKTQR